MTKTKKITLISIAAAAVLIVAALIIIPQLNKPTVTAQAPSSSETSSEVSSRPTSSVYIPPIKDISSAPASSKPASSKPESALTVEGKTEPDKATVSKPATSSKPNKPATSSKPQAKPKPPTSSEYKPDPNNPKHGDIKTENGYNWIWDGAINEWANMGSVEGGMVDRTDEIKANYYCEKCGGDYYTCKCRSGNM